MKENKIKNANNIMKGEELLFEDIKHIDEFGNEYWYARELMPLLEYRNGKILIELLIEQ